MLQIELMDVIALCWGTNIMQTISFLCTVVLITIIEYAIWRFMIFSFISRTIDTMAWNVYGNNAFVETMR